MVLEGLTNGGWTGDTNPFFMSGSWMVLTNHASWKWSLMRATPLRSFIRWFTKCWKTYDYSFTGLSTDKRKDDIEKIFPTETRKTLKTAVTVGKAYVLYTWTLG